jgi:hypothetical protein
MTNPKLQPHINFFLIYVTPYKNDGLPYTLGYEKRWSSVSFYMIYIKFG